MNFVERLAAKLDVTVDEADRLLEEFVEKLQQRLERGEQVELPGVGTFQQTMSGEIEFTPYPALQDVVNYRYAGLSTLAFPLAAESPDELAATPVEIDDASAEPLEEDADRFWDEQRTETPLGLEPTTAQETSFSVVDGEADEKEPAPEPSAAAADESADAADDSPSDRPTFPRKPRSSDSQTRRKLSIVAGLLITSGVLLLIYFAWFRGPSSSPTSAPDTAGRAAAPAAAPTDDSNTDDQAGEAGSSASAAALFEAPLRSSEGISPDRGGYTWIVGSLADRAAAEELHAAYIADGFRATIFRGGRGFRVAVGQFETIEDVLATRGELPEDVASDAWVLKIDSNMSPIVSS